MDFVSTTLEKFGLSTNEARVYRQIVKDGDATPYQLARETGIPRTTVYEIIMTLSLQGLVELKKSDGFTKHQTRIRAKNPSVLRSIIWQKRADLTNLEANVVDILPELKGEFHKDEVNADFRFFPGLEGARQAYFNSRKDSFDAPEASWDYLFPSDAFSSPEINRDVFEETRRRKSSKYTSRELVPLNDWTRHVVTYQYGLDPDYLVSREIRYLERPDYFFKVRFSVIGSIIRIVCIEDGENWGVIINSSTFAKSLMSLYEIMWAQGIKITPEIAKGWGENEFLAAQRKKRV